MTYYESRTHEHQLDFDEKNRAQKYLGEYREKYLYLRKEIRNLVRQQGLAITPEFARLIGLK
jgi:hypothetical protein